MKSTLVVLIVAGSFATGFGASHLSDHVADRESVPRSEVTRLLVCERAVAAARAYDAAKSVGADTTPSLGAYQLATASCEAGWSTRTTKAAK